MAEGLVLPEPGIDRQIFGVARRFAPLIFRTAWRRSIPFGLAVGAWHIRPVSNVPELEDAAGFGKGLEDGGRFVICCRSSPAGTRRTGR